MSKLIKFFTAVSIFFLLSSTVSALEINIENPSFESVKKSLWLVGLDNVAEVGEIPAEDHDIEVAEQPVEFPEELVRALQKKARI